MKLQISSQIIESYKGQDYTHWHALAEFIDNSTYWYDLHREEILKHDPDAIKCEVRITYDKESSLLRIADNSIGMDLETLESAMIIGKRTNRPGRSVYGMGLKTASIWLLDANGGTFTVKTKKAGSTTGYIVTFDYQKVINDKSESHELGFQEIKGLNPSDHYTVVEISKLDEVIQSKRLFKIKEYLKSMYREDFREDKLFLSFNEEPLKWDDDGHYTFLKTMDGANYKRDFSFTVNGKLVSGWIGIMASGGKSVGGLTILQHKRVIRGYPNTWKPEGLFGGSGEGQTTSLLSQRLVGEIHMDDFGVTHTKDNIKWSGDEELHVDEQLAQQFLDFKKIASDYRVGKKVVPDFRDIDIKIAIDEVMGVVTSDVFKDQIGQIPNVTNSNPAVTENILSAVIAEHVRDNKPSFNFTVHGIDISVYLPKDSPEDIYFDFEPHPNGKGINVSINLAHPYLTSVKDSVDIQQYMLTCLYDALSEYHCNKLTSVIHARTIRDIKNGLMKTTIMMAGEEK
jgi:Histidine kinase-, DNA gyrase B-, and HSP90-like ATPase